MFVISALVAGVGTAGRVGVTAVFGIALVVADLDCLAAFVFAGAAATFFGAGFDAFGRAATLRRLVMCRPAQLAPQLLMLTEVRPHEALPQPPVVGDVEVEAAGSQGP